MAEEVFRKIIDLLEKNKIKYKLIEHEPTFTSEESAKVRGTKLKQGAKALVLKSKKKVFLAVVPANRKINLEKLKSILNVKKLGLASSETVKTKTNCEIGAVPPFGNLIDLETYVDKNLLENEYIAFNAGSHTKSIIMRSNDFVKIVNPKVDIFVE
jgi:Cys-tRNA(Pro) deacylase